MLSYTLRLILFQAVKQESDGSQKRVCIDGKQRLTSVWRWVMQPYPFVYATHLCYVVGLWMDMYVLF